MLKTAILGFVATLGLQAHAATPYQMEVTALIQSVAQPIHTLDLIDWTVGDNADYTLKGGIINGTMHTNVREATAEGFWIQQDMDMGFLGKEKVEILYDKNTGAVLQLIVNDQKQTPPSSSDMKVIESRRDKVTVPKGTFDCIYAKVQDTKQNQTSEIWLNPELIPIGGMIKTLAPSQLGTITVELTNFRKQAYNFFL
jgi:hypothetical protein